MIDLDKATAYAIALDSDVAAQRLQQVRDGKLWRGYVGTIYGCMVATENGTTFDTYADALANARLFRERCRELGSLATLNGSQTTDEPRQVVRGA